MAISSVTLPSASRMASPCPLPLPPVCPLWAAPNSLSLAVWPSCSLVVSAPKFPSEWTESSYEKRKRERTDGGGGKKKATGEFSNRPTVISMGLGAYLAAATERQHFEAEYERECWEVDHCPDREREEIYEVLDRYGVSREGARGVVDELCVASTPKAKERWVRFMMDFELQLQEPDTSAAWRSAATMGLSYFVGGLVPMIPYFLMDSAQQALLVSIAITVVILLAFGYVKSWYVP